MVVLGGRVRVSGGWEERRGEALQGAGTGTVGTAMVLSYNYTLRPARETENI